MPDDHDKTVAQILRERDAAHAALAADEAALERAITAIDDIEWEKPLTAPQRAERERLRAAQTACRAAMIELSFVTLRALDNSAEVKRMANAFASINLDLKKALDKVQHVAELAETAAKVIAGIEKLATRLGKLLV